MPTLDNPTAKLPPSPDQNPKSALGGIVLPPAPAMPGADLLSQGLQGLAKAIGLPSLSDLAGVFSGLTLPATTPVRAPAAGPNADANPMGDRGLGGYPRLRLPTGPGPNPDTNLTGDRGLGGAGKGVTKPLREAILEVNELGKKLVDQDPNVRRDAVDRLAEIALSAKTDPFVQRNAALTLVPALKDENPAVQQRAQDALKDIDAFRRSKR